MSTVTPFPTSAPTPSTPSQTEEPGRFARAIRYLVEHRVDQPSLSEIADFAGLSPHYFERTFKRWAGVTPKQFLQFLTLDHAKSLLAESASVLDASYEVGLSSPGRLHDLFVSVEAVTPGEFKKCGEGMEVAWDVVETAFGEALVATTPRGVCYLSFFGDLSVGAAAHDLECAWPRAQVRRDPDAVQPVGERLVRQLDGTVDADGPLRLHLRGTNFQLQVWQALLEIPLGAAVSYGDLAERIGRPRAARAVASAVGANPVAILIPCHRVIRSSGEMAGYRWGRGRKRAILGWESARRALAGGMERA
ncbi:MAG TPA: methylated-DNA--[protein]-cysteine S-methyltransferase [Thermoanaerobaculia bacterium]|nr:methylated-DNA--[protein]-cysteine S-methyltransferase [Thermoanaerobaculia bacterium]